MAVPPNMIGFVESAGLSAVAYGPDTDQQIVAVADFIHNAFKIQNPVNLARALKELYVEGWAEMSRTLTALADGADLLMTGQTYHGVVANVAEYHDVPVAGLHHFPMQPNGQIGLPFFPAPTPVIRATLKAAWKLYAQITKAEERAQRRELGLPRATASARERMIERGSLEIQAYDLACFPGLAEEWKGQRPSRPFVGALTLELGADTDDGVASWIAAGNPPIYFGFGSTPVVPFADTLAMIGAACAQLGERALICSGPNDFAPIPDLEHVRIVSAVNHAAIFPVCRAVVHHGGAGTTAAALRAGTPTLLLWLWLDQPVWGAGVTELKVGSARQFSATTEQSLVVDLRSILTPQCAARAGEVAAQMTTPAESVASAADLLEEAARLGSSG